MNEFKLNSKGQDGDERGFTLIELMIVVVIIIVFSTLAIPSLQELVPRYRLNGTAKELAAVVQQARLQSIAQGVQYRLCFSDADVDAAGNTPSASSGQYVLAAGNSAYNSSTWDILPRDTAADINQGEGTHLLTYSSANTEYRGISLVGWTAMGGSGIGNQDCVMFTPRGWLDNPATDFETGGFIYVQFRNKYANPETEIRTVRISRGGSVTILDGPSGVMSTGSGSGSSIPDAE